MSSLFVFHKVKRRLDVRDLDDLMRFKSADSVGAFGLRDCLGVSVLHNRSGQYTLKLETKSLDDRTRTRKITDGSVVASSGNFYYTISTDHSCT